MACVVGLLVVRPDMMEMAGCSIESLHAMQDKITSPEGPGKGQAEQRGGMGVKVCAVLLLLLIVLIPCYEFHKELVLSIEWFCSLMECQWMGYPMMAYVIGGVGVFGLCVSIRAWMQEGSYAKQVGRFLKKALAEQWNKEKLLQECSEQGKLGLMFTKRMGMLLGDKHERLRHVVPSLAVMREISLRAELGRWGAAFVAVVVSILLILGIFATLMGVHSVLKLGRSSIEFTDLSTALLPSAIAVIFTVILTIFRAVHLRRVELLVARVDEACIALLMPILREKSEKAVDVSALNSATTAKDPSPQLDDMAHFDAFLPSRPLSVSVDAAIKEQIAQLQRFSCDMPSPQRDAEHDFTKERALINEAAKESITTRLAQCAIAPLTNKPS